MPDYAAPLTPARLLEIDDPDAAEGGRPWGEVTESARTFTPQGGAGLEVERSELHEGALRASRAPGPRAAGAGGQRGRGAHP